MSFWEYSSNDIDKSLKTLYNKKNKFIEIIETAKQLYDGVEKKVRMYVAKWMADSGYCYNMFTGETYKTSYANPAKWYDIDPTEAVPDVGCVVRQYSGNVYISLKGVETIVDQISSIVANPSEKQFS